MTVQYNGPPHTAYLVVTHPYPEYCNCIDFPHSNGEYSYAEIVIADSRSQARYLMWKELIADDGWPLQEIEWKHTKIVEKNVNLDTGLLNYVTDKEGYKYFWDKAEEILNVE